MIKVTHKEDDVSVFAMCSEDQSEGVSRQEGVQGHKWFVWSHHPLDINQLPCPGGGFSSFKPGTDWCLSVNPSSRQGIVLFSTLFLAPRYLIYALHTVGPQ